MAIIFTMLLPLVTLCLGAAVDFGLASRERAIAQRTADYASLAGAKELSLADANKPNVSSVVSAVVDTFLAANAPAGSAGTYAVNTVVGANLVQVSTAITKAAASAVSASNPASSNPMQVSVTLSKTLPSRFGKLFNPSGITISVNAVAVVVGRPNVCLLALDPAAMGTLYLEKSAKIVGQNCGVYSNSTHPNGIKAFQSSSLAATIICSSGGHTGSKGNFTPAPLSDCPQFTDPLADRPEPTAGGCIATNLVIASQTITLSPGTYCGGIKISGTSRVTLDPGIYVFQNGPLLVTDSASFTGTATGLYFTGGGARFSFATGTTISLEAPKDGVMAGMLIFASRSQSNLQHDILSDNARQLLGTIYLPTGQLYIDANQPIADKSAYTAIVALKVRGSSGPTVTLNTNYDKTDVPVPQGIRGANQPTALVR